MIKIKPSNLYNCCNLYTYISWSIWFCNLRVKIIKIKKKNGKKIKKSWLLFRWQESAEWRACSQIRRSTCGVLGNCAPRGTHSLTYSRVVHTAFWFPSPQSSLLPRVTYTRSYPFSPLHAWPYYFTFRK